MPAPIKSLQPLSSTAPTNIPESIKPSINRGGAPQHVGGNGELVWDLQLCAPLLCAWVHCVARHSCDVRSLRRVSRHLAAAMYDRDVVWRYILRHHRGRLTRRRLWRMRGWSRRTGALNLERLIAASIRIIPHPNGRNYQADGKWIATELL